MTVPVACATLNLGVPTGCEAVKQTALVAVFVTISGLAVAAERLPAEEIIKGINSSNWAVDPMDYGMTAMEYQQKEADLIALTMLARADLNEFVHFDGLSKASDDWIVTPNADTVYSVAVIDVRDGFSVEIPDVGDRFISLHVQDWNHTFVDYTLETGLHEYPAGTIETDYVIIGVRVGTDATADDLAEIANVIQPAMTIRANSAVPFETDTTEADVAELRDALLVEWGNLPDMYDTVQFDINDVPDWERWTYAIAGSWGLSPETTAMYASWAPEGTIGNKCYTATFDKVPAADFASLTIYDEDNYLITDEFNVVSTSRPSFIANDDGGFTIIFGGDECKTLAEERSVNYALTPLDGWRAQLRAYTPDVEAMKQYELPELEEISAQ
ncbi:MAG: DUF1254 domain-containing protein [Pseudomonadota bacterium]